VSEKEDIFKRSLDALDKALKEMTPEDMEKYFPKEDPLPEGWIDIEQHLPMVTVDDVLNNDGLFKNVWVKDDKNNEFETTVGDHNTWYYMAKEAGITHWYNGDYNDRK
jgi:hypothetical protein